MIKAILFDIDGTLSIMDSEEFMRNYVGLLAPRFAHLIPPDRFAKQVFKSTEVMVKHPQSGCTNIQTFFDDFTKAVGIKFNTLWPYFEEFYANDFSALKCLVKANLQGKEAVEAAIHEGYTVAIAANPVMPKSAILERIQWANLDPSKFAVIPSIEEFHFCKPQTGFFEELAETLDLPPEACMMVGNHPIEDMNASKIGMKTFLIGNPTEGLKVDLHGDMEDLISFIRKGNL